ncbi:MAG: hypothetical protein JOZ96_03525 [Acidobacteria bacterium]|nr:hypothetical protein [Acidobacteriota bacterium]
MTMREQIATELRRRAQLLTGLISDWQTQTDENQAGMGIHQSQVRAVGRMFDAFKQRQDALSKRLEPDRLPALSDEEFAQAREEFEQELTGSHSIMSTFRYIFAQRRDSEQSKRILDAADLFAAYSYLPCIKLANKWRGLPEEHYREPPLIYLNARLSPAAITREHYFGLIGLELYGSLEQQLPISVISLAFHDVAALWTFCSLYHEVGHLLDQDVGLHDELKAALDERLQASDRREVWSEWWLREMIADVFGVMLGGAGYARALMSMLYKTNELVTGPTTDVHPSPYVRMFLVGELLRGMKEQPLTEVADQITQEWQAAYGNPTAKWAPFVAECAAVADVLLNTKLKALGGERALLDFVTRPNEADQAPDKAADHARVLQLERYLRIDLKRPTPDTSLLRLVPAAAQLAAANVSANHTAVYEEIQQRALEFAEAIPHKEFLGAGEAQDKHDDFLDDFLGRLKFGSLDIERRSSPTLNSDKKENQDG